MHRVGRAILRALIFVALLAGTVVVPGQAAGAQIDRSVTTYQVDLDDLTVIVTTVFDPSDLVSPLSIAVPVEATQLEAFTANAALTVRDDPGLADDEFWAYYLIDLDTSSSAAEFTYRIPTDPPRSYGYTRINPAHIEFVVLPDPAFGNQDIVVQLPPGFSAALGPQYDLMDPDVAEDGSEIWTATSVHARSFQLFFVARNEDGLRRESIDVGGRSVEVAAWAEDVEWQDFAREYVGEGVPVLADLIGSRIPQKDLVVIESTAPYEGGAAGWFRFDESEIEVGDFLAEDTMLHELTHAWFNGISFSDIWMIEGFAEAFSSLALEEMTGEDTNPPIPVADRTGSSELADWHYVALDDAFVVDYYNTSWYVIDQLHQELGQETFTEVVQVMLQGQASYAVEGSAATRPRNDWRRFLDVLEETGESELAEQLFRTHVVPANNQQLLDVRSDARANYAELVAASEPFLVPVAVRDRMSSWKFQQAELLIADASSQVDRMHLISERADAMGITFPDPLRMLYEDAAFSFGDLDRSLTEAEDALLAIEAADPDSPDLYRAQQRFQRGLFSSVADGDGALAPSTPPSETISILPVALAVAGVTIFAIFMFFAVRGPRREITY